MQWDIFCKVIDNFGDIGVCWRLCADLARHGHTVRLWVDDPRALAWMAPACLRGGRLPRESAPGRDCQFAVKPGSRPWRRDRPNDRC